MLFPDVTDGPQVTSPEICMFSQIWTDFPSVISLNIGFIENVLVSQHLCLKKRNANQTDPSGQGCCSPRPLHTCVTCTFIRGALHFRMRSLFGLRPVVHAAHCGGLQRLSLVRIDFVPTQQPTANLEVRWRNEIASGGIDSHLTALTLSPQPGRDRDRQ